MNIYIALSTVLFYDKFHASGSKAFLVALPKNKELPQTQSSPNIACLSIILSKDLGAALYTLLTTFRIRL